MYIYIIHTPQLNDAISQLLNHMRYEIFYYCDEQTWPMCTVKNQMGPSQTRIPSKFDAWSIFKLKLNLQFLHIYFFFGITQCFETNSNKHWPTWRRPACACPPHHRHRLTHNGHSPPHSDRWREAAPPSDLVHTTCRAGWRWWIHVWYLTIHW